MCWVRVHVILTSRGASNSKEAWERQGARGGGWFWDAGNILCLDLGIGLHRHVQLIKKSLSFIFDLCTFLNVYNIRIK